MEIQRAIELIEKSVHVGILIPQRASLDILFLAEVLSRELEAKNKIVGFLVSPEIPERIRQKLTRVAEARPLLREFIVSLDTSEEPVSQIRYERSQEKIDIIFSPLSSPLQENRVMLRRGKLKCELAIALGITDIEAVNGDTNLDPDFFTETPLINFSQEPQTQPFGEVDLISSKSLPEIIYEFVIQFKGSPPDKENSTLLLAALAAATDGFQNHPEMDSDTFLVVSELMRLGADLILAKDLVQEEIPFSLLQLSSRAVIRSRLDPNGILWSFLTAEDWLKTGRNPEEIPRVMRYLEKTFPQRKVTALFNQDPIKQFIEVMLASKKEALLGLQSREASAFQSPYLKLEKRFAAFREAEEYIAALLNVLP